MQAYMGLYYPYVHFRDESWLKLAALYWDKMGRVVPHGYETHDSVLVRSLEQDAGFVVNFDPTGDTGDLVATFTELLKRHGDRLTNRYGLQGVDAWTDNQIPSNWSQVAGQGSAFPPPMTAPPEADPRLGYLDYAKVHPDVLDALSQLGLARSITGGDREWLAVNPMVWFVYMVALTEDMARRRRFSPVAEESLSHMAITGCTVEHLASVLLGDGTVPAAISGGPSDNEVEERLGTLALSTVVPADLDAVPVDKIIAFRERHRDEVQAFHSRLRDMVTAMGSLQDVDDPVAVQAYVDVQYAQLKSELDAVRKSLRSARIDTVMGAMNVQVALPPIAVAGGALLTANPLGLIAAGAGAVAYTILRILRDSWKNTQETVNKQPLAYLLSAERGLVPVALTEQIQRQARRLQLPPN